MTENTSCRVVFGLVTFHSLHRRAPHHTTDGSQAAHLHVYYAQGGRDHRPRGIRQILSINVYIKKKLTLMTRYTFLPNTY